MVTISSEKQIFVYNFPTRQEKYSIVLRSKMTCISLSRDSRYMLVNMADNEIQLIDIETAEIVRRFLGQKQNEYVIRSTFGGADQNLIMSGSEGTLSLLGKGTEIMANPMARLESLHMAQRKRHSDRDSGRSL